MFELFQSNSNYHGSLIGHHEVVIIIIVVDDDDDLVMTIEQT